MHNGYTLLWSKDRWAKVKAQVQAGELMTILFGGPHQSAPSFRKFGVKEGDSIYPITASAGVLYVLGRMKVKRILSINEYISENPEIFAGHESKFGGEADFGSWQEAHPEYEYLAPTCTSEVAMGSEGTPYGIMAAIPPDVLEGLRYCSTKGERPIKNVVDGRLKLVISIQGGTYRLCEASMHQIDAVLTNRLATQEQEANQTAL